ncbi:MAG: hypothetical protein ACUVWR_14640 [Anaerolineae bacterium]
MHWCPWCGGVLGGWGGWIGIFLGMLVPLALLVPGVLLVVWLVSSSRGTVVAVGQQAMRVCRRPLGSAQRWT